MPDPCARKPQSPSLALAFDPSLIGSDFSRDARALFRAAARDLFLIKASYWLRG